MEMITIVLADDHHIVRQGIRSLLEKQPDFSVVAEAGDGLEAVKTVAKLKPSVVTVDLMMPGLNGLEVTRQVRKLSPTTKVIILSMYMDEPYVIEALQSGASGYILKDAYISDLIQAIHETVAGHHFLGRPLSDRAIEAYMQNTKGTTMDVYDTLTQREREIMHLLLQGLTNADIAAKLFISPRTAELHRSTMMKKLGLRTQMDLLKYALNKGIILKPGSE